MPANAYSSHSMIDWQTPQLMRKSMLPPASAGLSAPVFVPSFIIPSVLLSVLLCLVTTRSVHAATPDEALPKWEVGLGVAAARLADYRGASHGRAYALPLPYGIYRGDRLKLDRDQNRFRIFSTATYSIDWSAAVSQPVKSKDTPMRSGMPDIDASVEWGPQLKIALGERWKLQTRAHLVSTYENDRLHERGYTVTPSINWELPLPHDLSLGARLAVPFASERYHDYLYRVLPQYAQPDRPAYDADAGFSGWNTQITLSRRTRHTWYGFFVSNHFMEDSTVESSPLIDDKTSWSAGFACTWLLFQSKEMTTE